MKTEIINTETIILCKDFEEVREFKAILNGNNAEKVLICTFEELVHLSYHIDHHSVVTILKTEGVNLDNLNEVENNVLYFLLDRTLLGKVITIKDREDDVKVKYIDYK